MPSTPAVWITLIVAVAAVVGFMIWKGVGGTLSKGDWKVALRDQPTAPAAVTVAKDIHISGGKVGKVTGAAGNAAVSHVDVATNAVFTNTEVGDITGIDARGGDAPQK